LKDLLTHAVCGRARCRDAHRRPRSDPYPAALAVLKAGDDNPVHATCARPNAQSRLSLIAQFQLAPLASRPRDQRLNRQFRQ
jgi:hypothetical protein